jgi:prolyl oligopeptidase
LSQEPQIYKRSAFKGLDLSQFKTEQVFYPSKDGTKVPMFLVSKNSLKKSENNPVFLYGYGGFNISLTPSFSVTRLIWLQHFNGIYVSANLRGGGEYGEAWYNAGRVLTKQNVFDDFISAAEYLIENKYTNKSKLVINGGSNGGLLVTACINQRPDLFHAAIADVSVCDMLRFHKFTIGSYWVSDYGCSDNKEQFEYMIKYSPLHTIDEKKEYPHVLLVTADHDDRVVPLHSYKYIAELQHLNGNQEKPFLIRIETKAGHGAGKPTSKIIAEYADKYAYVSEVMGLEWQK